MCVQRERLRALWAACVPKAVCALRAVCLLCAVGECLLT